MRRSFLFAAGGCLAGVLGVFGWQEMRAPTSIEECYLQKSPAVTDTTHQAMLINHCRNALAAKKKQEEKQAQEWLTIHGVEQPQAQEAAQPVPWGDVAASGKFQDLSSERKERARQLYFEDAILPRVPDEMNAELVRRMFDQATKGAAPNR